MNKHNIEETINYKLLLKSIYLKLYTYGYKEISLNSKELIFTVPKIQEVFEQYGIYAYDLFVKTPVSETYDYYKNEIINLFVNNGLGFFNNSYDSIIINCTPYYIKRNLEEVVMFSDIIDKCCSIIKGDNIEITNHRRLSR